MKLQVGGAVRRGALYVERPADAELVERLSRGESCHVVAPRQIGKSSLRVHATRALEQLGRRCAPVDLTTLGVVGVDASGWLDALGAAIADRLDVDLPGTPGGTPIARWIAGLRALASRHPQGVVILLDEIDVLRSLPFPGDDLLEALHAILDAQADDELWCRLSFALFGVSAPGALSADPLRTRFDIGHRVLLDDFSAAEADALLPAMASHPDPVGTLHEILAWTDGHPAMTMALCAAALAEPKMPVDAIVHLRLAGRGDELDAALSTIRHMVLEGQGANPALLPLYRRVLETGEVPWPRQDVDALGLVLTGIAARRGHAEREVLRVRNRVVATAFGRCWVDQHQGRREVTDRAWTWVHAGRRDEDLLHGQTLVTLETWAEGRDDLGVEETQLLLSSRARATRARMQKRIALLAASLVLLVMVSLVAAAIGEERARHARVLEVAHASPRLATVPGQSTDALSQALESFAWTPPRGQIAATEGLARTLEAARGARWPVGCGPLHAAAWSPDATRLAVACADGTVRLIQPDDGRTLQVLRGHEGAVQDLAWPAAADLISGGTDGMLRRWRLPDGSSEANDARAAANGPADTYGLWKVEVSADRILTLAGHLPRLWTRTGSPVAALTGHAGRVVAGTFSPDGSRLATADAEGTIHLWSASVGAAQRSWRVDDPHHLAFSHDGARLVVAASHAVILDVDSGTVVDLGYRSPTWRVAWGPGAAGLALSTDAGPIDVWKDDHLQATLRGPSQPALDLRFTATGELLAATDDDAVRVWTPPETRWVSHLHLGTPWQVLPTPDAERLAIPSRDGSLGVLRTVAPAALAALVLPGREAIAALALAAGGQVAVASAQRKAWLTDRALSPPQRLPDADVLAFLPDGRLAASTDERTAVVDTSTLLIAAELPGTLGERTAPCSPIGDRMVTMRRSEAWLWALPDLHLVAPLTGHLAPVLLACSSPDGQRVVTADASGTAILWRTADGSRLATLTGHTPGEWLFGAAWSPDGAVVVTTGFDDTARGWDGHTGAPLFVLPHDGNVVQAMFTPAGDRLVTVAFNRVARLWDPRTGQEIAALRGHTALLRRGALSPGGSRLATVADDGTVRLWRTDDGAPLATWTGGAGILRVVEHDDSTGRVFVGGDDGVLRVFPADTPGIIGLACRWVGEAAPRPSVCSGTR